MGLAISPYEREPRFAPGNEVGHDIVRFENRQAELPSREIEIGKNR